MRCTPIAELPRLHSTPLHTISIIPPKVLLEVDDETEKRFIVSFEPYQAVRLTTTDCFLIEDDIQIDPQTIVEVEDSKWLIQLRKNLSVIDTTGKFLDKAKHFLIPLQDDFLEVVAWSFAVKYL